MSGATRDGLFRNERGLLDISYVCAFGSLVAGLGLIAAAIALAFTDGPHVATLAGSGALLMGGGDALAASQARVESRNLEREGR